MVGNMTMNAAAGSHDDYVAAFAMAWFGTMHCAGLFGPPRDVRWQVVVAGLLNLLGQV